MLVAAGAAVSGILLLSSTTVYMWAYTYMVPVTFHVFPVYFDFAQGLTPVAFPDASPPTAMVNLLNEQWDSHERRLHLPSHQSADLSQLLTSNTAYDMHLHMSLPRTRRNRQAGSFMVRMEVLSERENVESIVYPECYEGDQEEGREETSMAEDGQKTQKSDEQDRACHVPKLPPKGATNAFSHTSQVNERTYDIIASSSRPVLPPYAVEADGSSLMGTFRYAVMSVPLLLGLVDDNARINVRMVEGFREHPVLKASRIRVILSKPALDVAAAELHIHTKLSGVRYLMYNWFFTTAFVGIGGLFAMQLGGLLILAYAAYARVMAGVPGDQRDPEGRGDRGGGGDEDEDEDGSGREDSDDDDLGVSRDASRDGSRDGSRVDNSVYSGGESRVDSRAESREADTSGIDDNDDDDDEKDYARAGTAPTGDASASSVALDSKKGVEEHEDQKSDANSSGASPDKSKP